MKLSYQSLQSSEWQEKGYQLPQFNLAEVAAKTKQEPIWLHLGAGNIFRAFLANLQQRMLNQGFANQGIIVAEGLYYIVIQPAHPPYYQ